MHSDSKKKGKENLTFQNGGLLYGLRAETFQE